MDLRAEMNQTRLDGVPVDEILATERILIAFIDGCKHGAGYVLASISAGDWRKHRLNMLGGNVPQMEEKFKKAFCVQGDHDSLEVRGQIL